MPDVFHGALLRGLLSALPLARRYDLPPIGAWRTVRRPLEDGIEVRLDEDVEFIGDQELAAVSSSMQRTWEHVRILRACTNLGRAKAALAQAAWARDLRDAIGVSA